MTNKEKFLTLVSKEKTNTLEKNKERIRNRAMLRESQLIAIKVLRKLEELKWSQKVLAEKMNVSPQQVNKIVRGQENLTLETQQKLQEILDIPILASYYENKIDSINEVIFTLEKRVEAFDLKSNELSNDYPVSTTIIKMEYDNFTSKYSYTEAI